MHVIYAESVEKIKYFELDMEFENFIMKIEQLEKTKTALTMANSFEKDKNGSK